MVPHFVKFYGYKSEPIISDNDVTFLDVKHNADKYIKVYKADIIKISALVYRLAKFHLDLVHIFTTFVIVYNTL